MSVETDDGVRVNALNSGAFQKLMDEQYFNRKALKFEDRIEALQKMTHDDLAPCYSFVEIVYRKGIPFAELKQWYMNENDSSGRFLNACDSSCSAKPGNCPSE